MNIGNFTFQDQGKGKVFIQIDGEGGEFNWSDVPSVVKAWLLCKGIGHPYEVAKEQEAITAMSEFWKKHF
jgi:hypothetical protein